MKSTPRLSANRTSLHIWLDDPKDPAVKAHRNAIVRHLRARGFRIGLCPQTKKHYPAIAQDHHRGHKGKLEVKIDLCGRCIEIAFFQNVTRINNNGGEYDWGSALLGPYVLRLRYRVECASLVAMLAARGLPLEPPEPDGDEGMRFITRRRAALCKFQGRDMYTGPIPDYNATSADKVQLSDATAVWFSRQGRFMRGIAFHNINNMWWVLLPSNEVRNLASFELHTARPKDLRGRHFNTTTVDRRLAAALAAHIAAERFERAATVRDVIRSRRSDVTLRAAA